MLPETTMILENVKGDILKSDVRELVRALYVAECQFSLLPDDKVKEAIARELVEYLIKPAQ